MINRVVLLYIIKYCIHKSITAVQIGWFNPCLTRMALNQNSEQNRDRATVSLCVSAFNECVSVSTMTDMAAE